MRSNRRVLEKKIAKLEAHVRARNLQNLLKKCNCRKSTYYHTAEDLQAILDGESHVSCPVHGVRDLGRLTRRLYDWTPLLPEDRKYCSCPPDCQRDFNEGKRSTWPTHEEIEADWNAMLERERPWEADSASQFQEERRRDEALTAAYYEDLARRKALATRR